ncbi:outer membrane protein OmpW [Pseudomonas sp. TKO26]|uniref:Outer membrane protein n=1 Tax=Pseudomonas saponiphila TaxID=556534 RepID=A0A1H4Q5L1_9PSED|nr:MULTISPECIES: OmpW family outer membrane protein [Pseudomonas]PYY84796.1 outer membrane protein OmpW [Pseudomonas sp. TKO30]PYY86704.1 outer membrane protein OmpW [Pseudomonas sp. TKO29]PYY89347.1 outer membrane protein OmpW [Pseudomonas sp. TKO26]PYY99176.1 outer membrane protein OmpW [Pseudomonas sp. TKO14]SEC14911.1 outer membrane protein [Pseudomonas saponiphila]
MRKLTLLSTSLLLSSLAVSTAQAFEAGDIIVRAGAVTVDPRESSSSVKVDRGALAGTNLGGKASLGSDTQLGLNFAYMLTNHLAVELLAATPFEHNVSLSGTAGGIADGKLGSLKHLPPTLSLLYYPMHSKSAFQPYVGAGLNYTWIYDEKVGSRASAAGFDNFRAGNSWGWAAQVGMDYMLTDRLMLNAQMRYIDINTDAYVNNSQLGVRSKVNVDVDPFVYMVGLGYKF